MASSLIASLQSWAIEDIQLGDRVYRIPPMTAAQWLEILLEEPISLFSIVPGLLEPPAEDNFHELVFNGRLSQLDIEELVLEIIALSSGWPWWSALYLIGNVKNPEVVDRVKGELALHGVDATRMGLATWLDCVYAVFTRNMETEARKKIDLALAKPPPGIRVKSDPAANRAALRALMASG